MEKEAKIDALAEHTMEVCLKVLVRKDQAERFQAWLEKEAQGQEGFVANVGGYLEDPESEDLSEVADNIDDDMVPLDWETHAQEKYVPMMKAMLGSFVENAGANHGMTCPKGIHDLTDDNYAFSVELYPQGGSDEDSVEVRISALESETADGEENGVNFMLETSGWQGMILGGVCCFNYTADCWVSRYDEDAIARRWALFAQCVDPEALIDEAADWLAKR